MLGEGEVEIKGDLLAVASWFSSLIESSSTSVDVEADGRMTISSGFSMMSTEMIDSPNISAKISTGSRHSGTSSDPGWSPTTSSSETELSRSLVVEGEERISS